MYHYKLIDNYGDVLAQGNYENLSEFCLKEKLNIRHSFPLEKGGFGVVTSEKHIFGVYWTEVMG